MWVLSRVNEEGLYFNTCWEIPKVRGRPAFQAHLHDPTPVNERKAPALRSLSEGEEEELETGTPVSAGALTMEGGHGAGQLVDLYLWSSESRHQHSACLLWHLVLPQLRKPC